MVAGVSEDGAVNSLADELRSLAVIMVNIGAGELWDVEVPADEVPAEPVETVDPPADLILKVLEDADDDAANSQGRGLVVTTIAGLITMSFTSSATGPARP